jgi:hypothetical protein
MPAAYHATLEAGPSRLRGRVLLSRRCASLGRGSTAQAKRRKLVSSHKPIDNRTDRTARSGRPEPGATASHQRRLSEQRPSSLGIGRRARRWRVAGSRLDFVLARVVGADGAGVAAFVRKQQRQHRSMTAARLPLLRERGSDGVAPVLLLLVLCASQRRRRPSCRSPISMRKGPPRSWPEGRR